MRSSTWVIESRRSPVATAHAAPLRSDELLASFPALLLPSPAANRRPIPASSRSRCRGAEQPRSALRHRRALRARAAAALQQPARRSTSTPRLAPGLADRGTRRTTRPTACTCARACRFHDGHELTSKDVVYTFKSILDPADGSPYAGRYRGSASRSSAVDPYTVEFVLKQPTGAFLVNLVMKIVPDGAGRELRNHPVGTGPYQFVCVRGRRSPRRSSASATTSTGSPRNPGVVLEDRARRHHARARAPEADAPIWSSTTWRPTSSYQLEKEGLTPDEARRASTTSTSGSTSAIRF